MNFIQKIKDLLLAGVLQGDPIEVHKGPDVGVEASKYLKRCMKVLV